MFDNSNLSEIFWAIFDCCDFLEMAYLFNEISEMIDNRWFFLCVGVYKNLECRI